MFRSVAHQGVKAFGNICGPDSYTPGILLRLSRLSFHTNSPACVMDKDIRGKKQVLKVAQNEKLEPLDRSYKFDATPDGATDATVLNGLTDFGFTIPTIETHSKLVDGVPYSELPVCHIQSSPNNTIMILTDHTGRDKIFQTSCGKEGFKNVKKSTNVAAQATGLSLGIKALKKGVQNVRVIVKGIGAGRLASIKGLQMAGLSIISLTDRTHVLQGGPRPRKAKRL